jgi:hypothetical protein
MGVLKFCGFTQIGKATVCMNGTWGARQSAPSQCSMVIAAELANRIVIGVRIAIDGYKLGRYTNILTETRLESMVESDRLLTVTYVLVSYAVCFWSSPSATISPNWALAHAS